MPVIYRLRFDLGPDSPVIIYDLLLIFIERVGKAGLVCFIVCEPDELPAVVVGRDPLSGGARDGGGIGGC